MGVLVGLLNQSDLYDNRVTTIGVKQVFDAVTQSMMEHNRQINALLSLFTQRTTDFQIRYETAAIARSQPLDENGRARPIKPTGSYTVGFPILDSGSAWGRNWKTSAKLTVGEVARIIATIQDGDSRWVRDHVLAALFHDGTYNFTDPLHGTIAVYGPASGDSTVYQIAAGADSAATDDHMKGAAAVATAVFTDVYNELHEHPENGMDVVAFIPTASKATVEALTEFYPIGDPNINFGSGVSTLARDLGIQTPGVLIGYIERVWVYEWRSLPSGYLIATTIGGAPALAMREEPEPELQGFKQVANRDDHPWYEAQFARSAGFGAWNRVGAIVYKTDNETYAVPTGYESPMP